MQHPESSTGSIRILYAILQLSALSFRELNRKINLFIETEVKKKKKNSDERALKVEKEDRGKVCWEISRGQDVGHDYVLAWNSKESKILNSKFNSTLPAH